MAKTKVKEVKKTEKTKLRQIQIQRTNTKKGKDK